MSDVLCVQHWGDYEGLLLPSGTLQAMREAHAQPSLMPPCLPLPSCSILFPLPIMALVPLRHHVMPRFFRNSRHLQELDAAHEEQVAPLSRDAALREAVVQGLAELAAAPGGAPGGGEGEEGPPVELPLPDSEMQHLRVVHHLRWVYVYVCASLLLFHAQALSIMPLAPPCPTHHACLPSAAASRSYIGGRASRRHMQQRRKAWHLRRRREQPGRRCRAPQRQ